MSHQDVEVVRELSRRFRAGDRDGAMALIHPDVQIRQPASLPHGGRHDGHAGMAAMGAAFAEHWDRTIDEPRWLDGGTAVVQLTTQTWTAKATGRSATVEVLELLTVTANHVVAIDVYPQDTHTLLATLAPA